MTKAILVAFAMVVGALLGVLGFLAIDSVFHPPLAVDESGAWTEYAGLILGGVGAISGLVAGRIACVWINKSRTRVPAPSAIPPVDLPVRSRKNCRPLTWLYRA